MKFDHYKIVISITLLFFFILYSVQLYTSDCKNDLYTANITHEGKLIWQKYNCSACHQIYGLGGYLGPDLTNEYSKRNEAFIIAFIKNGNESMPKFKLTDEEVQSLLQFFKSIDASGVSDPRTFNINYNGSIEQE